MSSTMPPSPPAGCVVACTGARAGTGEAGAAGAAGAAGGATSTSGVPSRAQKRAGGS
jgi:hypothetical protein